MSLEDGKVFDRLFGSVNRCQDCGEKLTSESSQGVDPKWITWCEKCGRVYQED